MLASAPKAKPPPPPPPPPLSSSRSIVVPPRQRPVGVQLRVDQDFGAGIEVRYVEGWGYTVEEVRDPPGQPDLKVGDVVVGVGNVLFSDLSEDDADTMFAQGLCEGAVVWVEQHGVVQSKDRQEGEEEEEEHVGAELDDEDEEVVEISVLTSDIPPPPGLGFEDEWADGEKSHNHLEIEEGCSALDEMGNNKEEAEARRQKGEEDEEEDELSAKVEERDHHIPEMPTQPEGPPQAARETSSAGTPAQPAHASEASELQPTEARNDRVAVVDFEDFEVGSRGGRREGDSEVSRFVPPPPAKCKLDGLPQWLASLFLEEYLIAASEWCHDMGAVDLLEVAENIEDFAAGLGLKPIEKQRVTKWAKRLLEAEEDASGRKTGGPVGAGYTHIISSGQPPRIPSWVAPPFRAADHPSTLALTEAPSFPQALQSSTSLLSSPSSALSSVPSSIPPSVPSSIAVDFSAAASASKVASKDVVVPRSVRLVVDSHGDTGLDLDWDTEWGIRVQGVDALPGQFGITSGDYIVAIDGCSLRRRSLEECQILFSERLRNHVVLGVVTPPGNSSSSTDPVSDTPAWTEAGTGRGRRGKGSKKGSGVGARLDPRASWGRPRRPAW